MQRVNLKNQNDICSQAIEDTNKKVEKMTQKKNNNQYAKGTKERISSRNKLLQQKTNNRENKNY